MLSSPSCPPATHCRTPDGQGFRRSRGTCRTCRCRSTEAKMVQIMLPYPDSGHDHLEFLQQVSPHSDQCCPDLSHRTSHRALVGPVVCVEGRCRDDGDRCGYQHDPGEHLLLFASKLGVTDRQRSRGVKFNSLRGCLLERRLKARSQCQFYNFAARVGWAG